MILTMCTAADLNNRYILLQGGMILHAQFEIWKAASSEESMQWMPESASSNASSGDMSDGKLPHLLFERKQPNYQF